MGSYALLSDIKKIMRASSRERIRFSGDALRLVDVGHLQGTTAGSPYNQSKPKEPIYTLNLNRDAVVIDPSYKGRDLINFVFTSPTAYNVYTQTFTDNSFDKRETLHGNGTISTTYDYDGLISFPPACWTGVPVAQDSVKIQFEADISDEDAEFFILNAEVAIDNMLAAAWVDYLLPGEQRLFLAPDIPPTITMATQYLAAYYTYTNVFAEQTRDPTQGHFTERWKRMCMDVLRDFAIQKNRLPPSVSKNVQLANFNANWERRIKMYFDTPLLCPKETTTGYSPDNEQCCDETQVDGYGDE